jgi:hypothetical protein
MAIRRPNRSADGWRVEADDEWLARHRSDTFGRLRRRLRRFGLVADAVSQAELGPFGGAPRNPQLKIGTKAYSVVRYAPHRITYTAVQVDLENCGRCGGRMVESHRLMCVREGDVRIRVGVVRMCRRCHAGAWLFHSRMPHTARARAVAGKVVL